METVMLVAVCFGALPFLGLLLWWLNDIWYGIRAKMLLPRGSKLPPGHMGFPILGETLKFLWYFKVLGRPDDFINSKCKRYDSKSGEGGMYRSYLFGSPVVIASSPAFCKFVFLSESNFSRNWPSVELIGHHSLSAAQGPQHRRLKAFISRGVNQSDALRRITLMVQPRVIATLQSWAQKGRVCAHAEAEKVIFENMGKYMVNFEPGSLLDKLAKHFEVMTVGYRANPINIPGTTFHRSLQSRGKVVAIFREEYEKRKKMMSNVGSTRGEEKTDDLLDGLMQFKDDEGKQLSDLEVIDNIVNLVVAGHKSTSLSVMWAVYYLAKCPHVLRKLREENIPLSQSKHGELITSDDLMNLKYTNKVVEETIRLANISMTIFRTAKNDVEYKGYTIPKAWTVVLWLRYLHTNPENFNNPMSFNPDRWNEPAMPGTYFAFGGGSRLCAGNMLARLQLAIFLHYLATGYKWELVNPNAKWSYVPFQKPVDGVEIFIERFSEA